MRAKSRKNQAKLPAYLQQRQEEDKALRVFDRCRFIGLSTKLEDCPTLSLPELVMAGKSNVGKSSLINALSGQKALARVSASPGKTKQLLYFEVPERCLICDLPGYGYARTSKAEQERFSTLVESYFASDRPFFRVLHLVDCRHDLGEHDRQMLEYLREKQIPFAVLLTKADKFSKAQGQKRLAALKEELNLRAGEDCFLISASAKYGLSELGRYLNEALDAYWGKGMKT